MYVENGNKTSNNSCCAEKGILIHCLWECKPVLSLWKTVWDSSKFKHTVVIWPSNPSSVYLPYILESMYLLRYRHPCVHGSITHSDQDMGTTEVSFDRGLDKEDDIDVYNRVLPSHKKRCKMTGMDLNITLN